jgi:hypothetical protein
VSRRFKSKVRRAHADPSAEPTAPVVLDDSNSDVDPLQPDVRKPRVLNTRRYARAESHLGLSLEESDHGA